MVKLTPELVEESRQFINPVKDRQLDLTHNKIPQIENLGATYNQFDTIDLSNNDLKRLENIPMMHRLKNIMVINNRVSFIQPDVGPNLPGLETLVLTNNNLQELGDLDPLAKFPKLTYLSLMGNPVTHRAQYRQYVIYKVPQLRVLDFRRIKQQERASAKELFRGKKGKDLKAAVVKKTLPVVVQQEMAPKLLTNGLPAEDVHKIKEAIASAKSLAEVENLQQLLASGQVPGRNNTQASVEIQENNEQQQEMEED